MATVTELQEKAYTIRKHILLSLTEAGSGHTGASLGLADIFASLYFNILNHKPNNPLWKERDKLILSIGHVAPVLYATLAIAKYFPIEELQTLRKLGSRLQGHPGRDHGLPGIELSAGSLGQGLSVSVGIALANKLDSLTNKTICIMGDGELQEGSVWEAAMSAAHHNLSALIAVVDRNRIQIDGFTENVMEVEPLIDKWKAFNWNVLEINGNCIPDILNAFEKAYSNHNTLPTVIIANTLMGKGVKSIENNPSWHGKAPNKHELETFLTELK